MWDILVLTSVPLLRSFSFGCNLSLLLAWHQVAVLVIFQASCRVSPGYVGIRCWQILLRFVLDVDIVVASGITSIAARGGSAAHSADICRS